MWTLSRRLWIGAGDDLNAEHPPELLAFARCTNDATDRVALAQAQSAHHWRWNVHIIGAWQKAVTSNEAVAIVNDFKDALGPDLTLLIGLRREDLLDYGGELLLLGSFNAELLRCGDELGRFHVGECGKGDEAFGGEVSLREHLDIGRQRALWHAHRVWVWSAAAGWSSWAAVSSVVHISWIPSSICGWIHPWYAKLRRVGCAVRGG